MAVPRNTLLVPALLSLAAALAAPAAAQDAYATSSDNKIVRLDFDARAAIVVVTTQGAAFQGLAVAEDAFLVADAAQGGGLWRYPLDGGGRILLAAFDAPGGIALSADGDLFAVSATSGGVDRVAVLPAGGAALVDVDASVAGVQRLADVRVVAFDAPQEFAPGRRLLRGDIVVLAETPGQVLRYARPAAGWAACGGACEPQLVVSLPGLQPTGFAFAPAGELLVTSREGVVARVGVDGSGRLAADFVQLPGAGEKIAVGLQDGEARVFATVNNQGQALRYAFAPDGTADPASEASVTRDLSAPEGVSLSTDTAAPLPAGANATVRLSALEETFESVVAAGLDFADCRLSVDPRGDAAGEAYACPDADGAYSVVAAPTSGDCVAIPDYVRPFTAGPDAPEFAGQPLFRVCKARTTARFEGLIESRSYEEAWLGEGVSECHAPVLANQPQFFYHPGAAPALVEDAGAGGFAFVNLTSVCNSDGAGSWRRSVLLPSVTDRRPLDGPGKAEVGVDCSSGILDCQLGAHREVLNALQGCLARRSYRALSGKLDKALSKFNRGDYAGASDELAGYLAAVEESGGAFGACAPASDSELRARARASLHQLGRLLSQP